jgi:hypothetical protein
MTLAPLGAMAPLEIMRELIIIKGTKRACLYGLGVLGLLGPSPPAKSKIYPEAGNPDRLGPSGNLSRILQN